jgi:hypothetical protein
MVKPSYRTDSLCDRYRGYQQALEDFAIPNLLTRLKTYSDADFDAAWMNLTQPELESLAAILIRQLTANLKGKAIAGYLNAIRHGSTDIPSSLVHLVFPPPSKRSPSSALVPCLPSDAGLKEVATTAVRNQPTCDISP